MKFVTYKRVEQCLLCLDSKSAETEILFGVLERFKLNEAIAKPCLRLLCEKQCDEVLDERLLAALSFYSGFLGNENVRLMCLSALSHLQPAKLLLQIPHVIFNVLLDDCEEIRMQGCELISPLLFPGPNRSFNLLYSLRAYVSLVSQQVFASYLASLSVSSSPASPSLILFEHEPLNEFLDLNWLEYNFK